MKNRKGFTLIELLVVLAILAILASVVISSCGGPKQIEPQDAKDLLVE